MEIVHRLDVAAETRALSGQEHGLRKFLKKKLLGLSSLEWTIARQRSHLLNLKEGDANAEFFHRHARHWQHKNIITSIQKDGTIHTGQDNIASAVDDYYTSLLGSAPAKQFSLDLDLVGLPSRDLTHLEVPFTCDEWKGLSRLCLWTRLRG